MKKKATWSAGGSARKKQKISNATMQMAVRSALGPMYNRGSAVPVETKYFDTSFTAAVAFGANWEGTEVPMEQYIKSDGTTLDPYTDSAIIPSAIGAGYGQVQGSKYFLKKVRVKGELLCGAIADQGDMVGSRTVRVVLVHDTQPNGAQAQGENVFTDMGSAGQCNYSFLAMAAGGGGRFRILADKVILLQPATAGTDGTNTNSLGFNGSKFKFDYTPKQPIGVMLKANSATPTVASLSNTNIFMLAHASGQNPGITILGAARAYYCD